jgi:hypothetical protein
MQNGNKITKKNWMHVVAKSNKPCTNVLGIPAIEFAKSNEGAYYETWLLKKEAGGYIFREINHNGGISGCYKTPKECVWYSLSFNYITVTLQTPDL